MKQETITLKIPGLTRDYTFYHTSDCHIAYAGENESEEAKQRAEKKTQTWSYAGIRPLDALDSALKTADENGADGIFLCGDAVEYLTEGSVACLREHLNRAKTEIFYVCGNHERIGADPEAAETRAFYPAYQDIMPGAPDLWVRDFDEFLIVGVDDGDKKIRTEQLEKLEALCAQGKPILLLIHIPIMTDAIIPPVKQRWGENGADYFLLGKPEDTELSRRFCDLLRRPDAPIAAVFAGHIHLAHRGELAPGRMQYTSAPTFEGVIHKVVLTAK